MRLPGMKVLGSARYLSSVSFDQVTPAFFIASEYLKPSIAPALRPTTPASDGPTLFLPASAEWQTAQLRLKTASPALTSSSSAGAGPAPPRNAAGIMRQGVRRFMAPPEMRSAAGCINGDMATGETRSPGCRLMQPAADRISGGAMNRRTL